MFVLQRTNRLRVDNLRTRIAQFDCILVTKRRDEYRFGFNTGVGIENAGYVFPNSDRLCIEVISQESCRVVRALASKRGTFAIRRATDETLRNHYLRTVSPTPACPYDSATGLVIHFGFTPCIVRSEQLGHIPPFNRQALFEQIDGDNLGGHDFAHRDYLVVVFVKRQLRIIRYLALQADVRAGLKPEFLHDSDMEVDDVHPLVERLFFLAGSEKLHHPLKRIRGLSHRRDDDHQTIDDWTIDD